MSFPPPSPRQARILWISVTALAIGVLLALIGVLVLAVGWVLKQLSSILLPLAVAGIIAYLLDPVVDYLEKRRVPRVVAIFQVFLIGLLLVTLLMAAIVPRLIAETGALVKQFPEYSRQMAPKIEEFIKNPPFGIQFPFTLPFGEPATNAVTSEAATNLVPILTTAAELATNEVIITNPPPEFATNGAMELTETNGTGLPPPGTRGRTGLWEMEISDQLMAWVTRTLPKTLAQLGGWFIDQLSKVASWAGLIIGFALVPVYTFYFLLEKKGISRNWTDYLPVHESWAKEEVVFILRSINDYLILFFRGQVLVALCDGILMTIGFLIIGLPYAVLIGLIAGLLSIVPFLGVMLSIIPTLILAAVQFGDWLHPILVLCIFGLVQFLEGFFISPKIMGDRVGLHPLTIIVAVMVGTTLMGGIIGGILAIPLTAALRVVMFRYVWKKPAQPKVREPRVAT